ncbi:carbonic anhydrase 1, partial [Cardiocondyla obscurior]|uniref:carbonic anhydrase 1 n=1 Tax=Cardiocondyla obscurior TaxID=286306 RepID=UPI00396572BD
HIFYTKLNFFFLVIKLDSHERNEETIRFIQHLAYTDGKLRSPIDLNISYMKCINLYPIQWCNYNVTPKKLKLTNTGYTVMLSTTWRDKQPHLCGGPFASSYIFSQLHFHWGKTDMDGSEHYVDGGSMPMELHAVHYNSDYGTQMSALRQNDGIAIVIYFFQVLKYISCVYKLQEAPNPLLDDIINTLPFIQAAHSSIRLIPFPLINIMRCFQRDYFVYWGSITMTNIRNSVLWIISREPLGISIDQVSYIKLTKLFNKQYN